MPSLRELQRAFTRALFQQPAIVVDDFVRGNGILPTERLGVYRNNVLVGFTKTLQATFPVVVQLVGDKFFRFAAAHYTEQHPSASGDLHDFGATFPAFLRSFEPAANLPYLADVAELEWAYHRSFHAVGHDPMDLEALGRVPQERYEALRFALHPAGQLLTSPYPVLRIWQVNQPGYTGDQRVDLGKGGIELLVIRLDLEIEIHSLEPGEYALLQTLAEDLDFAAACDRALAIQPDLDIASSFRRHVLRGTLVDFHF